MNAKIIKIAFISIAALLLSINFIAGLCGIGIGNDLSENRTMAEAPTLSLNTISEFPSQFEEYYNDNFPMRSYCVTAYNSMCYYLFKQGYNDNLVIGEDDWIFYRLSYYSNTYKRNDLLTEDDLKSIANYLIFYRDYCKDRGIEFYFVCPPDKSEVYPEKMPENIKQTGDISVLDQLEQYLSENTDIKVINVKNALLENKDKAQLYYSNGTHWNYYGSFVGYNEIISAISKDFPDINAVTEEQLVISPDERYIDNYIRKIGWGDIDTIQTHSPKLRETAYTNTSIPVPQSYGSNYNGDIIQSTNPSAAPNKLLVFRDSYVTWLQPYLSSSFGEVNYLWKTGMDTVAIDDVQPTILLFEVLERNLPNLLQASKSDLISNSVTANIPECQYSDKFHLSLDKAENSGSKVNVIGWCYIENCDTANQEKYVRFNLADGTSLDYKADTYYSNIGDYFENNKYDYARFSLTVPSAAFSSDIVSLQYIIQDGDDYFISNKIAFPGYTEKPATITQTDTVISPVSDITLSASESEIKVNLDLIKKTADGKSIEVKGWGYIVDCDTENQDKFVRLNLSDGTYLDYLANSYYSNIGDYFENNKYDYARFSLAVPIEQIGDEIKSLQIIFSENGKYYASKQIECVIE